MKNKLKRIIPYIINTLISLSIFLLILIITNTSPFGGHILGKSDAIVQFKPMLFDFIMGLKTNTLEVFSFNNGLGNPIIFNYLYYLSSPLNLIAILFKTPDAMYLSTLLLKIALATITSTFYFKNKTNNNLISTIGSLTYVFSSWFITYYYYLPWLDIFLIFPLFQYGLEELLNNKKYNIYILSLSFAIISNFYLTFPICIYTIIYFIIYKLIYCTENKKEKLNSFNRITLSTLFTLLISFVYIYALIISYTKMGLSFDTEMATPYSVKIIDLFKSLIYGNISFVTKDTFNYTFPNIAINTFMLFNFIYYFLNNKINKKAKIFTSIGILIFLCSIYIRQFDFALNFFHNIRGLSFRYSFIPVFLSITVAVKNLENIEKYNIKNIIITSIIILIPIIINIKNIDNNILIFNIISTLTIILFVLLYQNKKIFNIITIILIITQSVLTGYFNMNDNFDKKKEAIEDTKYSKETTKYRLTEIGNENEYVNWNLYSNANTTYLLTSMTYNRVINLSGTLGCQTFQNTHMSCFKNNKITEMYFNEKNEYYLEKIFSVNKDILNISLDQYNTKNSHEYLVEATTGIKDIYDKETLKAEIIDNQSHFKTEHNFYLIDQTNDEYTVNYPQTYKEFLFTNDSIKETTIYTLNEKKLKEIYEILSKNQIEYEYYTDSHIKGTINVEENQMIYTSIPYDTSWEIKIDNKKVNPTLILDSLIGIEVNPGTHTIEMKYKTNYTGPIIVSLLSLLILITNIIYQHKKKKN